MKAPREQDLVKPALQLLALRGVFAWRNNSGAICATSNGKRRFVRFGGMPGSADVLGVLPGGRFLGIELKKPGGKPTAKQEAFLAAVRAAGGVAWVVSSLAELEARLGEVLAAPHS
jgi:hypothetical protein